MLTGPNFAKRVPAALYQKPAAIFAGTAEQYVRHRTRHPDLLLDHIHQLARQHAAAPRLLDLGCGPGLVALQLARRGCEVIAVDPSPEMLTTGRRAAKDQGIVSIDWREGTAENLTALRGLAEVAGAVIADAFHWMDRPKVLGQLDETVAPGGFVAVLCSRAAGTPRPWWHDAIGQVRVRLLGAAPAAGRGQAYQEPLGDHETVLRASAFRRIAATRLEHVVRYTTDELIGTQFTYAYSSPGVLGDKRDQFVAEVRRALLAVEPSGQFTATVTSALIVGWRS